jgi:hypothetical protein
MKENQLELFVIEEKKNIESTEKKKCSCCKQMLPYDHFGKNKSKSLGLACTCKKCLKESRDVLSVLHKKNKLPKDYCCAICNRSKDQLYTGSKRSEQPFRLDHCKKTGNFRGWICDSCNTGLGKFSENVDVLYKAWEYLKNG